jgi:tetratricopeptide (TPR) repeat protein
MFLCSEAKMKKHFGVFVVLMTAMALCAPKILAQYTTGTIKGVCRDAGGEPIQGGVVVWRGQSNGHTYTLKTNQLGQYLSMGVLPGIYNVTLYKNTNDAGANHEIFHVNGFQVTIGGENTLDFDNGSATQQSVNQQEAPEKQRDEVNTVGAINEKLAAAKIATDAGDYEAAIANLTAANRIDDTRDLVWFKLGDAYRLSALRQADAAEMQKRFDSAIAAYQRAIAINPAMGAYHNNLAEAYSKSKKIDSALSEYAIAAQVDSSGAASYIFNMGAVLTNAGRANDAISAFTLAIKLDPSKADAYYWKGVNLIGLTTIQSNEMTLSPRGTKAAFQKYLELSPTGKLAKPATDMLTTVKTESDTPPAHEQILTQAFEAAEPYNSRGDYKTGMEAEVRELSTYEIPWLKKAADFWADPAIASALQQQRTGEGQAQAQPPEPPPLQCSALDQVVQIDDAMPTGAGHCAGEADFWFTNTSKQAIECAIIFHKNGRFDPASALTFTLSPGEKSGGTGKISTCGADSGEMQYQCFTHAENAGANSCTAQIQWHQ